MLSHDWPFDSRVVVVSALAVRWSHSVLGSDEEDLEIGRDGVWIVGGDCGSGVALVGKEREARKVGSHSDRGLDIRA